MPDPQATRLAAEREFRPAVSLPVEEQERDMNSLRQRKTRHSQVTVHLRRNLRAESTRLLAMSRRKGYMRRTGTRFSFVRNDPLRNPLAQEVEMIMTK